MKENGQVSNSAKAVKINCSFEQINLRGGVSDHCWVQNLNVLTFMYLSRSSAHLQNIQVKTLTVSYFGIELEPKAVTNPGSYIIREQLTLLGWGFFVLFCLAFFFPFTIYTHLLWKIIISLLPAQLQTS